MAERTYLAVDLNNAEKKEMPILFGKASNERSFLKNIGITCYTGSTKYNRG